MKKQPGPSPSPANERPPQSGQPVLVADSSNTVSPDNPERRPPLFDITEKRLTDAIIACRTEVLEKIATGVPLAGTLTTMLSHMEALAPEMVCSVLLLDAGGERLKHGAAPGLPEEFIRAIDGVAIGPRVGSCGTAAFRREPVIVEDIATDPLWTDYRAGALAHGLRACWSTPIFDAQQRVLGTFAIYYREPGRPNPLHRRCIDLATDLVSIAISRQRTEAALRASEVRYRTLVERMGEGLLMVDNQDVIQFANRRIAEMLGYTVDQMLGRNASELLCRPEDHELMRQRNRDRERDVSGNYEIQLRHQSGEFIVFHNSATPIHDGDGVVTGSMAIMTDITGRKRAEQELQTQLVELRRWQDVTLGREDRVQELKREVNDLRRRLGEPPPYAVETTAP